MALAVAVLLLLALTALGHGALLLAERELQVSRVAVSVAQAHVAAEAGLTEAARRPLPPELDTLPLWGTGAAGSMEVGTGAVDWTFRRLGPETWLTEATGSGEGVSDPSGNPARARRRSARVSWVLSPAWRVGNAPGTVAVGDGASLVGGDAIDPSALLDATAGPPAEWCSRWRATVESILPSRTIPAVGVLSVDSLGSQRLGRLSWTMVVESVPAVVEGSGRPDPSVEGGVCRTGDPWNWGDSDHLGAPCGTYVPAVASSGDLVVDGGSGQLFLVVPGDLTVRGGSRLRGFFMVDGELRLETGAELVGLVQARRGITLAPGAAVLGSACWAGAALDAAAPYLRVPVPLPDGRRVEPF